jgi:uncharacterized protein Yka (UPF0111/DUF47 family)
MFDFLFASAKPFFPLLVQQTNIVENAAQLLLDLLKEDVPEKRKDLYRQIKDLEEKGDEMADYLYAQLYKSKLASVYRENIQELASRIDTFLDFIHDSSRKIVIYDAVSIDPAWVEVGDSILEDTIIISGLVKDLSDMKGKSKFLAEKCQRIKDIENDVDEMYEFYMSNLFKVEKNAISLTKNKNIMQSLEDTTDKAKDIAEIIKILILKRTF